MKIHAIKCPRCGDIIYSRHIYDFKRCRCGFCAIDGGREYTRVVAKDLNLVESLEIEVDSTSEELESD